MLVFSMRFSEVDLYAVRSYSFAVRKTNSFFSVATLLLSAAVLIIAGLLCTSTTAHLWLPRSALPLLVSQSLSLPEPLSSSLICYASSNASSPLPAARLLSANITPLAFPVISSAQLRKQRPRLAAQIPTDFACFDLQGYNFQAGQALYVQVQSNSSQLYIQGITTQNLQYEQQSSFMTIAATNQTRFQRTLRFISATIMDKLYLNYQPQIINKIRYDTYRLFGNIAVIPFASNNSVFALNMFVPTVIDGIENYNYNVINLSITRYDIGYILGAFLSWVSVLGLACGLAVGPLMERALALLQAETAFMLPEALRTPSLLRFVLGSLHRGIFRKEDFFSRLVKRLDELKDVALSLKLIRTLRKVSPKSRGQPQVVASEHSFDRPPIDEAARFSESANKQGCFKCEEDTRKAALPSSLLRWLDGGSDAVSVRYAGGGHGSGSSVCATLLFFAAFLAFLALFGVFGSQSIITSFDKQHTQPFSYTFSPGELLFGSNENASILFSLFDGNYRTLSNISLNSDPKCLNGLTQQQLIKISGRLYYYCFSSPLTITYSLNPDQFVSLYLNNINFKFSNVRVFHMPPNPIDPAFNYNPIDISILISTISAGSSLSYQQSILLTSFTSIDQGQQTFAQMVPLKKVSNRLTGLIGINFVINPHQAYFVQTQTTLFDMVQNIWGFATICFAVVLVKVTKYINLRAKKEAVSEEKAEYRDNICVLMSKISGLMSGRHRKELERMKYYVKERLSNDTQL